jgi:hypothetical protein
MKLHTKIEYEFFIWLTRKLTRIKDFFEYRFCPIIKRYELSQGVKNLIRWFPVIWKDRDYDHFFIYYLLREKLKQMEDFQLNHGHCVSHKEISHKIKICRILLDRLINDDYLENATAPVEKRFGEWKMKTVPYEGNPEWSELVTYFDGCDDQELAQKYYQYWVEHSRKMEEQDLDELFTRLRKQIRLFWD